MILRYDMHDNMHIASHCMCNEKCMICHIPFPSHLLFPEYRDSHAEMRTLTLTLSYARRHTYTLTHALMHTTVHYINTNAHIYTDS